MRNIVGLILLITLFTCSLPSPSKSKVIWMVDSIEIDHKKVLLQSNFASLQNNKTFLIPIPINNSQQTIYETDIENATGNYNLLNDTLKGSILVKLNSNYKTYNGLYYAELYNLDSSTYLKLEGQEISFYFVQWVH